MDEKNDRLKIGLALSGGSALGIAHIGAIKALLENEIPIDFVSGTSAGSIAAVGVAFGIPLEKLIELSRKINWTEISQFGYSKMGLVSNEPLKNILIETIGDLRIEDSKIPLAIVATDIDTGKEFVFRKGKVVEAVMASTCLPGFFVPVKFKSRNLVDGGLVENLPFISLKEMGAQVRIGIDLDFWGTYKKAKNVFDIFSNSLKLMIQRQRNVSIDESDIIIKPHLEKFSSSDFEKVDELIKAGYETTNKLMPEIKKIIKQREFKFRDMLQKLFELFCPKK
jgi:NTE family protein